MVLHVFISFLGGVPLCIPYGFYSGTSLGGTTRGILGGFSGRVLSQLPLLPSAANEIHLIQMSLLPSTANEIYLIQMS